MHLRKNIGETDRMLRIIFGLALLSITFFGPKTMWGLLGFIPILTAVINFCPLYAMLGINTLSIEHKK